MWQTRTTKIYNQVFIILDTTSRASEFFYFFFNQFIFVLQQGCGWAPQLSTLSCFILKFLRNAVWSLFLFKCVYGGKVRSVQERVSPPRTFTWPNRTHEALMILNCAKKEIHNHIRRKVKYFQSLHKNNLEQTSVLSNLGLETRRTACLGEGSASFVRRQRLSLVMRRTSRLWQSPFKRMVGFF